MTAPRLFDPGTRARHMARATEDLLHREAATELSERLDEVNRTFPRVAITGHAAPVWARALAGHPRLGAVETLPEAETLAFGAGGFDLVIHALWLHWSNDPVGALVQARLALRPDGLLLAPMLGGRTLAELRAVLAEAEAAETGGLSPRVAPMGEIRDLGALLQRAGFAMPVADTTRLTLRYRDAFHLMRDLRAMGEANALTGRLRMFTRRGVFARAAALYAGLADADGLIPASFETVWLTGWAPGPDQPVARRPGSATTRLADALGTREVSLPDPAIPRRDDGPR
jgi:SAM-dependent methyltransferase